MAPSTTVVTGGTVAVEVSAVVVVGGAEAVCVLGNSPPIIGKNLIINREIIVHARITYSWKFRKMISKGREGEGGGGLGKDLRQQNAIVQ